MAIENEKGQKAISHMVAFYGESIATGEGTAQVAYRWVKDGLVSSEVVSTQQISELFAENPELATRIMVDMKEYFEWVVRRELEWERQAKIATEKAEADRIIAEALAAEPVEFIDDVAVE